MAETPRIADVFATEWGWAGLCASACGLRAVLLPTRRKADARHWRKHVAPAEDAAPPREAVQLLARVRGKIQDYFAGKPVDFAAAPLDLSDCPPFARAALAALAKVGYGRRITYGELAAAAGNPKAARAAGAACARNPMPLVIPCHRVLAGDGALGGFSAAGGVAVKARMLALENEAVGKARRRRGRGAAEPARRGPGSRA